MLDDVDMRLTGVGVILSGRVHGGRVFGGVLRRRGRRHHVLFVRHDFSFLSLVVKNGLNTWLTKLKTAVGEHCNGQRGAKQYDQNLPEYA